MKESFFAKKHEIAKLSGDLLYAVAAHALGLNARVTRIIRTKEGFEPVEELKVSVQMGPEQEYLPVDHKALEQLVWNELKDLVRSFVQDLKPPFLGTYKSESVEICTNNVSIKVLGADQHEARMRAFAIFKLGVWYAFPSHTNPTTP